MLISEKLVAEFIRLREKGASYGTMAKASGISRNTVEGWIGLGKSLQDDLNALQDQNQSSNPEEVEEQFRASISPAQNLYLSLYIGCEKAVARRIDKALAVFNKGLEGDNESRDIAIRILQMYEQDFRNDKDQNINLNINSSDSAITALHKIVKEE